MRMAVQEHDDDSDDTGVRAMFSLSEYRPVMRLCIVVSLCLVMASIVTAQPAVYATVITHNEEPPGNPNYAQNPAVFWQHRAGLVRFAQMLYDEGVPYHFQSDWNFLLAVQLYDTGTVETNHRNVVRWIREDLGFEVDPHAHETQYNYADVAFLIQQVGVTPSHVVGGYIAWPPQNSILEHFWQPITGNIYNTVWQAEILWGGGTGLHQNEDTLWTSGVWRPESRFLFLCHADNALLPNVGRYVSTFDGLQVLLGKAQDGTLLPGRIYTQTTVLRQTSLISVAFVDSIRQRIRGFQPAVDAGLLHWVFIPEMLETWQSEYASTPSRFSFLTNDYVVCAPVAVTISCGYGNVSLRWHAVPDAVSYRVFASATPGFQLPEVIGSSNAPEFSAPADQPVRFFRITAVGP